ncbi:MAG: hypothetical protein E7121_04385 [Bacteroidales bacterium]|nr:hypothetical protein [Bacteroidales bacterium]
MEWGLDGITLSSEHRALYMDQAGISALTSIVNNVIIPYYSPYYDYYHPNDLNHISNDVLSADDKAKIVHDRQGYAFCEEIISETNTTANINEFGIGILDLGHDPQSAIEYCYNKNKRNSDGSVATMTWYLPAIDEMEDIAMGGYNTFFDFQAQDYWSSQPAFVQNAAHYDIGIQRGGSYMTDNENYARATSVEYLGGGADNPNNYTKKKSSMNNYYQVLNITGLGQGGSNLNDIPNDGYNINYLWYSWSYPKYSLDAGYQPRTEQNRIRCVRKMN